MEHAAINANNEHEAWPDGFFGGNWDDVPASGVVTFAPGQTSTTVPITINADLYDEWNEIFLVSSTTPRTRLLAGSTASDSVRSSTTTRCRSSSRAGPHALSESDFRVIDVDPVTLSARSGRTIYVDYHMPFTGGPGITTHDVDYYGSDGTLFIAPFSQQLPGVTILPDDIPEPDEYIGMVMSNPVNTTIGGVFGIGSILIPANDGG